MDIERMTKPRNTGLDAAVRRIIDRIENGQPVWIRRVQQTLELDSNTRPTMEDVVRYVGMKRKKDVGDRS